MFEQKLLANVPDQYAGVVHLAAFVSDRSRPDEFFECTSR